MRALSIRHSSIVVSDLNNVLPFYRDTLQMKVCADFREDSKYVQKVTGVSGAEICTVNLQTPDGGVVQLQQYLSHFQRPISPKRCCDTGLNHLAIEVDDIEEVYRVLNERGVPFTSSPQVSSQGIAKVTCCQDPEGNLVELVEML